MLKINESIFIVLLSIFWGVTETHAQQSPVVFNYNEAARPGEAFNLQGTGWGKQVELWGSMVRGNENALAPSFPIQVIGRDDCSVTGLFPSDKQFRKNALIAVWVKSGTNISEPVFLNRARAVTLEFEEIMPGYVFRIFGRNLFLPG